MAVPKTNGSLPTRQGILKSLHLFLPHIVVPSNHMSTAQQRHSHRMVSSLLYKGCRDGAACVAFVCPILHTAIYLVYVCLPDHDHCL